MDRGRIRAVLLGVEGTTTPVDFVHRSLLPYARSHVEEFLRAHLTADPVRADVRGLYREHRRDEKHGRRPPPWEDELPGLQVNSVTAYVHWLMDRDRKSIALKSLQGRIWEAGFARGELRGELYPDVPPALERWNAAGLRVCTYSWTSALAQRLLLARSTAGDLAPFLHRCFDAGTGPPDEPDSYRRIAIALGLGPGEVLFISDGAVELDAAAEVGMNAVRCARRAVERGEGESAVIGGLDGVLAP